LSRAPSFAVGALPWRHSAAIGAAKTTRAPSRTGAASSCAPAPRPFAEGASVFKLAKLLIGVVALAAFVWFGANVSLGSRTLFEHLQAIGRTRETKDLLDGTREKAKPLVDSVRRKLVQEAVGATA